MIVNKNINPERDLYYLGGKVIEILDNSNKTEFDYFELYGGLNKNHNISINLFSLVLDWLFILGVIKKGKKGLLERCF
ncbi:ABC-three component system middle component 6 [Dysgonomonas sp. UBA7698]|uniref:ABC-three component system middle component 6 n=1 Tax=Dysgonomonas sp. UBA7698 TaxID=1946427 RepID=UPI0025BDE6F4|nr:ABC-three component system middle component 6 [Dysgonomonas sp. UBA7698]